MPTGLQFINGKQRAGTSDDVFEVIDPSTGSVLAVDHHASPADADEAVTAARNAWPDWAATTAAERSAALIRLAELLARGSVALAESESQQTGKPIRLAREFDVAGSVDNAWFYAGIARDLPGKAAANYSGDHESSIRLEPLGVIAAITPWNYPLQIAIWKVLPAIAAGNTVVLKPSELTPLTSLWLAQAAQEAGIPDGVVNVLTGSGTHVGSALVEHPDVAMVSFTGSTAVGRQIASRAAGQLKRTQLELGGKAPFIVFDDADLDAAARGAAAAATINAGQDCTAATRAYVQRPLFDSFVAAVASYLSDIKVGPIADESTDLGSLISLSHRDRVHGFVTRAASAGAKVVIGGGPYEQELAQGAYYQPTLITDAPQRSELVQKEVFGPVLALLPFETDDEAYALANDTPYGLAASAWTSSVFRAQRAASELQAGCVWINDHIPIISEMPHGGYKQSGYGKDMSTFSFIEYLQIKHVMSSTTPEPHRAWHDVVAANLGAHR